MTTDKIEIPQKVIDKLKAQNFELIKNQIQIVIINYHYGREQLRLLWTI